MKVFAGGFGEIVDVALLHHVIYFHRDFSFAHSIVFELQVMVDGCGDEPPERGACLPQCDKGNGKETVRDSRVEVRVRERHMIGASQ